MDLPCISILIPVYNGSNFLREAIDSALAQTYPHFEVLVVNDGSRDNGATEAIALSYGDRIRYIAKPNGGVASALNLGLEQMQGDFVSWLSHDDVYLPEKLALQMDFWQRCGNPSAIVYGDVDVIDAAGRRTRGKASPSLTVDDAYWRIWGQSWLNGCAMLIPGKLLTALRGFRLDLPTTQDYDLWLRLARTAQFCHLPRTVLLSRVHGAQGSATLAHRLECAGLFAEHLPELLDWCRSHVPARDRSRVVAWCLLQRGADYGWPLIRNVVPILCQNSTPSERLHLAGHLLLGLPKALLRRFWIRLPGHTRDRMKSVWKEGRLHTLLTMPAMFSKIRQSVATGGAGALLDRGRRYLKKLAVQKRRLANAGSAVSWNRDSQRPLCLILDHDSGGGTQAYREQQVAKRLTAGADVLVWQYVVHFRRHLFELHTDRGQCSFKATTLNEAQSLVLAAAPATVFINSLVGWPDLPEVFKGIQHLQQSGARVEFFLHDFFAACPVYVLLDRKGRFCGLPTDLSLCERCLPQHPLAPPHAGNDLQEWRRMWEGGLQAADAVRVADDSVRELYARVYTDAARRMEVLPHAPLQEWTPLTLPQASAPGVIGVVGTLTRHKGAGLVEDLVRLLEQQQQPLCVVVVGTLESSLRSPLLTITGTYAHANLPKVLEHYRITVGLVPSPLPETFCYVAQELENLGLPLVCLDLGAQGSRARRYALGRVARTPDAEGCLEAILELERLRTAR